MATGAVIGHGVDLVDIDRIAEMLERHGDRFTERCFTPGERAYADAGRRRRAERYAARFACKEAVLKALGTGWRDGISWTDVAVVHEPSGRPAVELSGRCRELARASGWQRCLVSLSHAGPSINETAAARGKRAAGGEPGRAGFAMASVVVWGRGGSEDPAAADAL